MEDFKVLIICLIFYQVLFGQTLVRVENEDVIQGKDFIFKCEFNDSISNSIIKLQKNQKNVFYLNTTGGDIKSSDSRVTLASSTGNVISLKLQQIDNQSDNNAEFRCLKTSLNTTNVEGNIKYILTVLVPPIIELSKVSLDVYNGDNVQVTCSATGKPPPYVWWKDEASVIIANRLQSINKLSYKVDVVKDILLYCVAGNDVGDNITKNISVHVKESVPSTPLEFVHNFSTDPKLNKIDITLNWKPSKIPGKSKIVRYEIQRVGDDIINVTEPKHTFRNLNVYQRHKFLLKACNIQGCGEPVELTVESAPVVQLIQKVIQSTSITVQFLLNQTVSQQDIKYQNVCMTPNCKDDGIGERCNVMKNNISTFDSLRPFCNYSFVGHYTYSQNLQLETNVILLETKTAASDAVRNISVQFDDNLYSILYISWERPIYLNSPYVDYEIEYTNIDNHAIRKTGQKTYAQDSEKKIYSYKLTDLSGYTKYEIQVVAINSEGIKMLGEKVTKQTDEPVPNPPRNLQIVSFSSNKISLKWQTPISQPEVSNYQVHVGTGTQVTATKATKDTHITIMGLDSGTNYTVAVISILTQKRTPTKTLSSNASVRYFKTTTKADPEKTESATLIVVTSIMLLLVVIVLIGAMCYCRRKDLCKTTYNSNFYVPAGFTQETPFQPVPFSLRQSLRTAGD